MTGAWGGRKLASPQQRPSSLNGFIERPVRGRAPDAGKPTALGSRPLNLGSENPNRLGVDTVAAAETEHGCWAVCRWNGLRETPGPAGPRWDPRHPERWPLAEEGALLGEGSGLQRDHPTVRTSPPHTRWPPTPPSPLLPVQPHLRLLPTRIAGPFPATRATVLGDPHRIRQLDLPALVTLLKKSGHS